MKNQFALSAIRKNGFLVYKNDKVKTMAIRRRGDYLTDEDFRNAVISFETRDEAENFINDNSLASVEVVALDF